MTGRPEAVAPWQVLARSAPGFSAHTRFDPQQRRTLWTLAGTLVLFASVTPGAALVTANLLFSAYCLALLGFRAVLFARSLAAEAPALPPRVPDAHLPMVSVLCALYKEEETVPRLIEALSCFDYPPDRLEVLLLVEADDQGTRVALARQRPEPPFRIIPVPAGGPRTKPKALCHGLDAARGGLVVVYDAEDRPAPDQLRKAAETFAAGPGDLACLQAQLNFYNANQTVLTRLFAIEYAFLFDVLLPALDRLGLPIPLGGTSNIFRVEALRAVGGWDPYNVTEDADLGLRLAAAGWRTGTLASTTLEEAVPRPAGWLRQRSRWIKGYLQTWLVHNRRAVGPARPGRAATLQLVVGAVAVSGLINPLFWAQYILWLGGWAPLRTVLPEWVGRLSLVSFLGGNLFYLWLAMLAPLRRGWFGLVPSAVLMPVYWILQSVAAFKAFWDFCRRPHHWEKTTHTAGPRAGRLTRELGRALP